MNTHTDLMVQQLDRDIEEYVQPLIKKRNFIEIHSENLQLGACRDYQVGNLRLRIATDRGLICVEVAPATLPSKFRAISAYRDLLEPPDQGRWNLSLAESIQWLDKQWDVFQQMMSPDNCEETIKKVDTVAQRLSPTLQYITLEKSAPNAIRIMGISSPIWYLFSATCAFFEWAGIFATNGRIHGITDILFIIAVAVLCLGALTMGIITSILTAMH